MIHACTFDNCGLVFNRPWRLKRHVECHLGIKLHACTQPGCAKSYSTSSHLKRHVKTCHDRGEKRGNVDSFACSFPHCDSVFATSGGLLKHEAKHVIAVRCDECNRFFRNAATYETHAARHRRKRQRLLLLDLESEQVPAERTERPEDQGLYLCEDCNSTFASRVDFVAHCKTGHEPLPAPTFCCGEAGCRKVFRHKRNLKEHIRNCHATVTTLFVCAETRCAKAFRHKRNLTKHVMTKHVDNVLRCPVDNCGRDFRFKKSLLFHVRQHENDTLLPQRTKKMAKEPKDLARQIISSIVSSIA